MAAKENGNMIQKAGWGMGGGEGDIKNRAACCQPSG